MAEESYTRTADSPGGMSIEGLRQLLAAWQAMGVPDTAQPIVRVTWGGLIKSVTIRHDPAPEAPRA